MAARLSARVMCSTHRHRRAEHSERGDVSRKAPSANAPNGRAKRTERTDAPDGARTKRRTLEGTVRSTRAGTGSTTAPLGDSTLNQAGDDIVCRYALNVVMDSLHQP